MIGKKREHNDVVTEKIESEEPEYEDIYYNEPSLEEIQNAQTELSQVSKKMKLLQQEEKKLENLLKGTKAKELINCFRVPRDEFVFKIIYDNGEFYEKAAKNYLTVILKKTCLSQTKTELEILDSKCLSNYMWFKVNKKIKINWLVKKSKQNDNYQSHTITQLRVNQFFEDL